MDDDDKKYHWSAHKLNSHRDWIEIENIYK